MKVPSAFVVFYLYATSMLAAASPRQQLSFSIDINEKPSSLTDVTPQEICWKACFPNERECPSDTYPKRFGVRVLHPVPGP